jgi:membrane protease YdiL (CAAX protease family)
MAKEGYMVKLLITIGKTVGFFTLWGIAMMGFAFQSIREPAFIRENGAFLRLWWELLPFLGIALATFIFIVIIEKNSVKVSILTDFGKNSLYGLVLGIVWLGFVILILFLTGHYRPGNINYVPYFNIWLISVFINVVMQEYLVRGYLFSLFNKEYNLIIAIAVTTVLFTLMHGGAFESGIIAVLNVVTMSVFVSLLLVFTRSLLAPIIAHFIWNSIGCLVLGVVSLADDYPNLISPIMTGNNIITGRNTKIEGSIIVLIVNIFLIAFLLFGLRKPDKI